MDGLDLAERDGDRFVARCARVSAALVRPRLLEIEQLLARAAGMPVRLEIVEPDPDDQGPPPSDTPGAIAEPAGPTIAELRAKAEAHPLVQAALQAFDAELLNVYPHAQPKPDPQDTPESKAP